MKPGTIAQSQRPRLKIGDASPPPGSSEAEDPLAKSADEPASETRQPKEDADGQLTLIDTDHPANEEIETQAGLVAREDRKRSKAQRAADEGRAKLRELLAKHNIKRWVRGNIVVEANEPETKISVTMRKRDGDKPGDETADE